MPSCQPSNAEFFASCSWFSLPNGNSVASGQRMTRSEKRGGQRPQRRAAPSKASPLGGQRSTRSDKRGGQRPQRRAAPSKASPLGGQRSTRSDKRGGHIIF